MLLGILLYDLIYLILATALYGSSALAAFRCARGLPWFFGGPVFAVVFLLALIAEVGVLTHLLPPLSAGRYLLLKDRIYYSWLFRSLLRRILFVPGLKWLIFTSGVLRFLALRALGAKVAFASFLSVDVDLLDPSLTTIEAEATLGARVMVSCHYVSGGKLLLREVRIGRRAMLAAESMVAPGATVGPKAVLGARASLGVQATVEEGAEIGGCAVIDSFARIGAGAQIGSYAYVPAMAEVPPGERWVAATSASPAVKSAAPAV